MTNDLTRGLIFLTASLHQLKEYADPRFNSLLKQLIAAEECFKQAAGQETTKDRLNDLAKRLGVSVDMSRDGLDQLAKAAKELAETADQMSTIRSFFMPADELRRGEGDERP